MTVFYWVPLLLFSSLVLPASSSSAAFDAVPLIKQRTQQLTTTDLHEAVRLFARILAQHNVRRESTALQQYVEQLHTVLQPDCCDFFAALATVKGLTAALLEVLQLGLPAALRPVLRRSYVSALWLLQHSKFFVWDSHALHSSALSGLHQLFDAHMAAAGRPISFHHISKTGGTSLCSVAWQNGCRGPGMSKKDNCLLDPGVDGPVWVLRHNVTATNSLTPIPAPPPAATDDSITASEAAQLAAATHRVLKHRSYDWFMYDCPADRMGGRVGRGCSERQEGAVSKSATFFASENTLPTAHGSPQVCEAFVNVIILREAVSAAVSLMAEVSLVYGRLLKQHRVLGWAPAKWDLAWWQQWAPAAVSSYATRTLLGAGAFCPAAPPAASPPAAGTAAAVKEQQGQDRSAASSSSSAGGSAAPPAGASWQLSADDIQRALHVLASFDVVLDLGQPPLMDVSLAMLLGWSGQSYSTGQRKRSSQAAGVHTTWEQLELLARQLPPPLKGSPLPGSAAKGSSSDSSGHGTGSSTSYLAGGDTSDTAPAAASPPPEASTWQQQQRQQGSQEGGKPLSAAGGSSSTPSSTHSTEAADLDALRRLIGEVRVRQVYSSHGLSGVLLPLAAEVPLASPPAAVVSAAVAALAGAQQAPVSVEEVSDGAAGSSHLLVRLHAGAPGQSAASAAALTAAEAGTAGGVGATGDLVYHVWLRHGVVLEEQQYRQLLQATSADAQLYRFGRVMQALDAGWVSVLGQQRRVRKAMAQVQEEAGVACGFAGLNHLQS